MEKRRLLPALLCAAMLMAPLPGTALAAGSAFETGRTTAEIQRTAGSVDIAETEHGKVTVKTVQVNHESIAVITPEPDQGYQVDAVTVKTKNGMNIEVTDNGDGTYSFVMTWNAVTVAVTFRKVGKEDPTEKFIDVPKNAWYLYAVDWAMGRELMNGVTDNEFQPDAPATRAMVVEMLWRMEGSPADETIRFSYSDVWKKSWYAQPISWATGLGFVIGNTDGSFRPRDGVTREQLAGILYRYAQYKGMVKTPPGLSLLRYADGDRIRKWSYESVCWAVSQGLLGGIRVNGRYVFVPNEYVSRGYLAAMMMRYDELSNGNG